MTKWMIQTKALTKAIQGHVILDHVAIHLPAGKIYGLLGPNGAGKTTLMKLLLGLQKPTSGAMYFMGERLSEKSTAIYTRSGSMIEEAAFYGNLTATENLEILAEMRGVTKYRAIKNVLENVRLDTAGKKKFREFSMGMKQRLGIAAALLHEPELLILDEPINGLDPMGIKEIREMLLFLNKKYGTTILISSHILSEIEQMVDVIGFLNNGYLVEEVSLQELQDRNRDFIRVKVSDVKRACFLLEDELGISDYEVSEDDFLRIYSKQTDTGIITSCFVKAGLMVYEISNQSFQLEDYFSRLIGGDKHAFNN
ncbi:ATP-binding cassette domain-containing protein [uncultured Enterococcus sp.]|uniref:ABC transporter ATP-binding protein n=1 Tax=uncultured Enterococcus sp. TaxID=167972 RepID=UPI002AA9419F|nr:ATP-binding cassette domain-containing protein [uncultured Enterococcus sp.]